MNSAIANRPQQNGIQMMSDEVLAPVGHSMGPIGDQFLLAYKIATTLSRATLIPDHLRGVRQQVNGQWQIVEFEPDQVLANVLMVVNRALQWGVDPIALIGESFVVGGKLDFQGKVIAAVVNKLGRLKGNLNYAFSGEGDDLTVTVTGELQSEPGVKRTAELSFKDAATYKGGKLNEQWTKDVKQKLIYSGAKKWARRHTPEVVLGLFSEEEDEPAPQPRYIDSAVVAVPRIDGPTLVLDEPEPVKVLPPSWVVNYETRIAECESRTALRKLVDKIHSEPPPILSSADKDHLVSVSKIRWRQLPNEPEDAPVTQSPVGPAADSVNSDPALDDKVMFYEAMITESTSQAELQNWIEKLDADEAVPIAMRKELGKFANERSRKGFAS